MANYTTLTGLFTGIADALRRKTGGTGSIVADDFPSVIDSLSTGGITPTGTKTITTNGAHDVTSYATANVNVPASGITPTGTKTITANGEYDVSAFELAQVAIEGLNAKIFNVTVASDKTSTVNLISNNDYLKSLRDNPKAFVLMRFLGVAASTAMVSFWVTANFTFYYSGTTAYNSIIARATASTGSLNPNGKGLKGDNYNAHLNINSSGTLWAIPNATFPIKAGEYQVIAGTVEML